MSRARWISWALAGLVVTLFVGRWLALNAADRWWAEALGVADGHGRIDGLRFTLFVWTFGLAATWFTGNLFIVYRSVGSVQVPRRLANIEINEAVPRRTIRWWVFGTGVVLAFATSYNAGRWWIARALAGVAEPTGIVDPILGRDLGYYLFSLPWTRSVHGFATLLALAGVGLCIVLYVAVGAVAIRDRRLAVTGPARRHLAGLLAVLALVLIWGYRLEGPELVAGLQGVPYDTVLIDVRLPTGRLLSALGGMALIASLLWFRYDRLGIVVFGWTALGLFSILGHYVVPSVAAGARVPEEMVPPIITSAQRTLRHHAFGRVNRDTTIAASSVPTASDLAGELDGAPIWDEFIVSAYLNADATAADFQRFAYASIGRYERRDGRPFPVFVSVREHDVVGARDAGAVPSWQAVHAGELGKAAGVVAIRGDTMSATGAPLFVTDVTAPHAISARAGDLDVETVLFSPSLRSYFLEHDASRPGGPVGVPLGGVLRRLALAWRLQSLTLLTPPGATSRTTVVWHRGVVERLERYAPFARFELPQPVLVDGRLYWMAWGYVAAAGFPLSRPVAWRGETVRYLRAAFLGVVDGTTGDTRVFLSRTPDPLGAAWARLAPDIVAPAESLPAHLEGHPRYPVELFTVQAGLWREPAWSGRRLSFFGSDAPTGGAGPGSETFWWLGTAPGDSAVRLRVRSTVERGSPPLLAALVEGVVQGGRPRLTLFRLRPPLTIPGPSQIAERFAAEEEDGIRGALKTVPVGNAVVSVQSVYAGRDSTSGTVGVKDLLAAVGSAVGRGRVLSAAAEEARGLSSLPPDAMSEWVSARRWFQRLDAARDAADWRAFGEAYEALRGLFGTTADSTGAGEGGGRF